MKHVINLLKNKIFIGAIGIIAIAAVIWFGADLVKFGEDNHTLSTTARLAAILFILLTWVTALLISQWRNKSKSQQMLDAINETPSDDSAEDSRSKEEIATLNKRFDEAIAVLRKSGSKGSKKTVYELPWYIIIGPPGAGKTTALINSGLKFPLAESQGQGGVGGVGGTRDCDWWFTDKAVLLDTAGRYTTQDSHQVVDQSAWNGFLKLLKKFRPRRPINGAIVAISILDLMTQTRQQRLEHAKTIKDRIAELQTGLGIRLPIYVMFTKCDLISGFCEYFANLTQPERNQIWGVTLNAKNKNDDANSLLESIPDEFDQLVRHLNERVMWRIHNERDITKRALIQRFPLQVESLKSVVTDFISDVFSASRYDEQTLLRGFYLSSGTQDGIGPDFIMSVIGSDYGFSPATTSPKPGRGQSFFINRVFNEIIFPEAELVGSNLKFEKNALWLRRGYFGALAAGLIACLTLWSSSVSRNSDYMEQINTLTSEYQTNKQELKKWDRNLADTLKVLTPLEKASTVFNQSEHPWLVNFGLYDAVVDKTADQLYQTELKNEFLPRLLQKIADNLKSLPYQDERLFDNLRAYIMLTQQERRDPNFLERWTKNLWQDMLPGEASKQQQLSNHFTALLESNYTVAAIDETAIAAARNKLKQIPVALRLYNQIKASELGQQNVDLYSQIGGRAAAVFGYNAPHRNFDMPILFTEAGYKELDFSADANLLQELEKNRWVFGDDQFDDFSEKDKEALAKDLKELYMKDYRNRWQTFLDELHIQSFQSFSNNIDTLKLLSDPVYSPLVSVLKASSQNTTLTPEWSAPKALGQVAKKATDLLNKKIEPTPVDIAFRELNKLTEQSEQQPPPITEVLAALRSLHDYLDDMAVNPETAAAAFNAAKSRFGGSDASPIKRLRILSRNTPAPMQAWLNEIADHSWGILLALGKTHLDNMWQQKVVAKYNKRLSGHYPMSKRQDIEVDTAEFNEFFKPGGLEAAFVNEYIKPFINSSKWSLRSVDGQSIGINNQSLQQFKRAEQIRSAFFASNKEIAGAAFKIKPRKLDTTVRRFELQLGKQRINYTHGPKISKRMKWISSEDASVAILFEDLNKSIHREKFQGAWAWLKLLEASQLQKISGSRYRTTFNASGRKAEYDLNASSRNNPFELSMLRKYQCPNVL